MHLLLPPSETKNSGGRGRPLRARATSPLADPRARVYAALGELVRGDPAVAAAGLLLPAGVADAALAADARVLDSPTTPALRRYAGTVYEGLDAAAFTPSQARVAARSVLVFSGLFGVVSGDEAVPDYRVPAKAALPGIGVVGTFWSRVLGGVLTTRLARGLVVDLRSGDYRAMWRPDRATAARTTAVRVLSPTPRGPSVVSYPSKLWKGRLAAELIRREAAGGVARDADDVVAAWLGCGGSRADATATGLDLHAP